MVSIAWHVVTIALFLLVQFATVQHWSGEGTDALHYAHWTMFAIDTIWWAYGCRKYFRK